jgi:hypothetical protein
MTSAVSEARRDDREQDLESGLRPCCKSQPAYYDSEERRCDDFSWRRLEDHGDANRQDGITRKARECTEASDRLA